MLSYKTELGSAVSERSLGIRTWRSVSKLSIATVWRMGNKTKHPTIIVNIHMEKKKNNWFIHTAVQLCFQKICNKKVLRMCNGRLTVGEISTLCSISCNLWKDDFHLNVGLLNMCLCENIRLRETYSKAISL